MWQVACAPASTKTSSKRSRDTPWWYCPRGMSATLEHVDLPIVGMTCASCANRIERKLNKLEGVSATVNYATEKARVEFDPGAVAPEQLVGAVEAAGYQAVLPSHGPAETGEAAALPDA